MISSYDAGLLCAFKTRRRAHSWDSVTAATTLKTDKKSRKIGMLFASKSRVQPAERASLVWAAPASGRRKYIHVGVLTAFMPSTPLAGAAQTCRGEKRGTGYTPKSLILQCG